MGKSINGQYILNACLDVITNIYFIIGVSLLLILSTIIIVLTVRRKKRNKIQHIQIDQAYISELISLLGTKENIQEITVDGNKLKVTVLDLDKTNLEGIKEKADSGVFVVGNNIKTLFKYDSETLKNELKKYKETI